jgi:hypothetical protein
MINIYPYKYASKSARTLASFIGATRLRSVARNVRGIIINWGSTTPMENYSVTLNKPEFVTNAVNKIKALQIMKLGGVRVPEFTTDKVVATGWLSDSNVYCRTLTRAHGGKGIIIAEQGSHYLPNAPLYTRGIDSPAEYRVHVFRGEVIDYTKKIPNIHLQISENYDTIKIKSHQNGWTFARNVQKRDSVCKQAIKAVEKLQLDFGAVDIIINEQDKPVVLEVNTACGLQGRTLTSYREAINKFVNSQNNG